MKHCEGVVVAPSEFSANHQHYFHRFAWIICESVLILSSHVEIIRRKNCSEFLLRPMLLRIIIDQATLTIAEAE